MGAELGEKKKHTMSPAWGQNADRASGYKDTPIRAGSYIIESEGREEGGKFTYCQLGGKVGGGRKAIS